MYKKEKASWMKHIDFTIIDLVMLEAAYVLAFGLRFSWRSPSPVQQGIYYDVALIFALISVTTSTFTNNYHGILKRSCFEEFKACFTKLAIVMLIMFAYFFATQKGIWYSRLALGGTAILSIVFTWGARCLWKCWLYKRNRDSSNLPQLLIMASYDQAVDLVRSFAKMKYREFSICGIVTLDGNHTGKQIDYVPIVAGAGDYLEFIRTHVVDEVFMATEDLAQASTITDDMLKMGVIVHSHINSRLNDNPNTFVEKVGGYTVLTTGVASASVFELLTKRLIDIVGSIVGMLICAIAFIFVAPGIYFSSPGPIIFKQQRVGRQGRIFQFYKFRSMYLDAEERKAKLMEQNEMSGFMFKMDNDPRVFPFGRFIRRTSIDELPNFWNVFKGDMSLVGTRPPTVDEYEKYELHHKVRLAIKPGITGLWQVSGRSQITDFEEVVKLDQRYIENWSLGLDVKILLKTIWVVLTRKGSA